MKRILLILFLLQASIESIGQTGVLINRYYITGSLALGKGDRTYADTSAWLELGRDTTKKGLLFPKVILDSVSTTKKGLFVYDIKDSVLYHFDGTKKLRYMTYKDTAFIRQLVLQYVPYTAGYGLALNTYVFKADTTVIASKAYVNTENNKDLKIADTAAMLLPYLRKADTASMSSRINQKINYTDTTSLIPTKAFLQGNYFKNGGNAFAGVATVGTTDNNAIDVIANNTRAMRIFANGNMSFGTGTTDAGYKGDFTGSIRATALIYSSAAFSGGGIGTEWGSYIGWRNGGQGWRNVMESNGLEMTIRDLFRPGSPISGIAGLKIEIPTDGSVSISNAYNISALSKITAGYSRGGGNPSTGGVITSGEHIAGATNMPGTNLTIQGGRGTGNNINSGHIYFQTPDTIASGNGSQNYSVKVQILRNGALVVGNSTPATNAILEVQSTSKGVILSKMTTTQRDAISPLTEGLEIYNTTTHKKQVYDGTLWQDCW